MTSEPNATKDNAAGETILNGLTLRSFLIGCVLAAIVPLGAIYSKMQLGSSFLAGNFLPIAFVFCFTIVVLATLLVKKFLPSLALRVSELIIIAIMLLAACAPATFGFSAYFAPTMTSATRFGHSKYKDTIIEPSREINENLMIRDEETCAKFWDGINENDRQQGKSFSENYLSRWISFNGSWNPLDWGGPVVFWVPFILTFYFVIYCIMTILRKQWVEKERLTFPLVQLPVQMIEGGEGDEVGGSFFRNRLMWIGFAIPILINLWNSLPLYFSQFAVLPEINLIKDVPLLERLTTIKLRLAWPIIAVTYLIPLPVSFSIWFFYLLNFGQDTTYKYLQYNLGSSSGLNPAIQSQSIGAVIVLVLVLFWVARRHLAAVFKKAFVGGDEIDDSNEPMSYRFAVFGLLIGLAVLAFIFLRYQGFTGAYGLVFLFVSICLMITLTRVVAEGGLLFVQFTMTPQVFMLRTFGSTALGPGNLLGIAMSFIWICDARTGIMPFFANSFKIADRGRLKRRHILGAAFVAVVISITVSVGTILYCAYNGEGARKADSWFFEQGGSTWGFRSTEQAFKDVKLYETRKADLAKEVAADKRTPSEATAALAEERAKLKSEKSYPFLGLIDVRTVFIFVGGLVMLFLMFMQHRFLWWPLHPIGYPFASSPAIGRVWLSIMIGWFLKAVILRYGGVKLFRFLKPIFLGLLLGEFFGDGIFFLLDVLLQVQNHRIY